jgi:hypothetical protein
MCFISKRFPQDFPHKTFRTIDPGTVDLETNPMARYSAFLGRAVEVQYRAGDICLPASGTFVADSGRSIFLEQHYEQLGQLKNFRWEIPYPCIVRLEEVEAPARSTTPRSSISTENSAIAETDRSPLQAPLQVNAARASAGSSVISLANETESA